MLLLKLLLPFVRSPCELLETRAEKNFVLSVAFRATDNFPVATLYSQEPCVHTAPANDNDSPQTPPTLGGSRVLQAMGVETFIQPHDITHANKKLLLAFCAQLFNTNPNLTVEVRGSLNTVVRSCFLFFVSIDASSGYEILHASSTGAR